MPIIAKAVISLDGKAVGPSGPLAAHLGPEGQAHLAALRSQADALCFGIGTVLADDPPSYGRPSFIFDSMARTPPTAQLVAEGATVVVTDLAPEHRLAALEAAGAKLLVLPNAQGLVPLSEVPLPSTTLIEGGGQLLWSFLQAGLTDQLYLYYVPEIIGAVAAPSPIQGPQPPGAEIVASEVLTLGSDLLVISQLERREKR